MLEGVRTCPACHSRVLPAADDTCPSCRKYKFTGAALENPSAEVLEQRRASDWRVLEGGVVRHWSLVLAFSALLIIVAARFALALARSTLDDAGLHDLREIVGTGLAVLLLAAVIAVFVTASLLRTWLRDADERTAGSGVLNILLLLKHSVGYFENKGVPVGMLGPRLSVLWTDHRARKVS